MGLRLKVSFTGSLIISACLDWEKLLPIFFAFSAFGAITRMKFAHYAKFLPAPSAAKPSAGKAPCRTCSHTRPEDTSKSPPPSGQTPASPTTQSSPQKPAGPPNPTSFHPRLGLARVLTRSGSDPDAARRFYEEVITMAPGLHDAYIELGEILVKSDPLGAVEVYSKYPFTDPLTYDDAYLHGEIARLLMKHEKFWWPAVGCEYDSSGESDGLLRLGEIRGNSRQYSLSTASCSCRFTLKWTARVWTILICKLSLSLNVGSNVVWSSASAKHLWCLKS